MPFPFFSLPLELRYIIYQYLFTSKCRHNLIVPAVGRLRRAITLNRPDSGRWRAITGLNCQTLSLIRTCQQAHDESTNVLYSDNTFCFDDVLYDKEDMSWYFDLLNFPPIGCETSYFYPFLSVIGRANRMKLRHLDLNFHRYTTFPLLGDDNAWGIKYKHHHSVASFMRNALDFLSKSHRLQSLVLTFQGSHRSMAGFSFWFSKDSELYRSLTRFKAIRELKCRVNTRGLDEMDDAKYAVYEKAVDNYHELRAELEAAYEQKSASTASSTTKNSLQNDSIPQFGASS